MIFDSVYANGTIISMDSEKNNFTWIGVKDKKIQGLGHEPFDGEAVQLYDLGGKTILPGLSDCHTHVLNTGIFLTSVLLDTCTSLDEVLQKLEDRCIQEPGNGWIFGSSYLMQNIKENRYPTKFELDQISHGHKIVIFAATMHACALNSQADAIANVPVSLPGVELQNGISAGIYTSDESVFFAHRKIFSSFTDDEMWHFIQVCANYASSKGVTSIHGLFGQFMDGDRDIDLILERKDQLPVDMEVFYQIWDPDVAKAKGLSRVGGCLTLDGAAFEYTMANFEPYNDRPELRGVLYHNDQEVYDVISKAHANNMQCTLHAVGERAIDQLLYTYHRVISEQGQKDLRHRLEHFCLPTDSQIALAKKLNIILSMQPGFSYRWDGEKAEFAQLLGRERADKMDPFQKAIDAGIVVVSGSDSPVTGIDPLLYIAHCIAGYNPVRNVSITDAIKMCTINAAYSVNKEQEKGSLEIGKAADFIVINHNPYHSTKDELFHMKALCTVKDGAIVYGSI